MVRNPVYQIGELRRCARAIGWSAAVRLCLSDVLVRAGVSKPKLAQVRLKNSTFPIYMRTHTSDRDVLRQAFIHREYEIPQLSNPNGIIDLSWNGMESRCVSISASTSHCLRRALGPLVERIHSEAATLEHIEFW